MFREVCLWFLCLIGNSYLDFFTIQIYTWLPITRTLANWNQNWFPPDFCHTFTVILPSVARAINNLNLPLTQSRFCFPSVSDNFHIILPLITRTMFWTLKSWEKTVYWHPKHWILNFPLTCCRYIISQRLMLFVTNLTWNSFTSQNSKMHALF